MSNQKATTCKTPDRNSGSGASGKLLVSYALLENLGEDLSRAAKELAPEADRTGAMSGASDVDQTINRFTDTLNRPGVSGDFSV